jgi:hypothetical protein
MKKNSQFKLVPLKLVKLLPNFENPTSYPLQRPYSGDFDNEMLTGSSLGFCKIIPEAACEKLIHAKNCAFLAANERSALEH